MSWHEVRERGAWAVAALVLAGCVQPQSPAPAPTELTVARSAEEAVQVVAVTMGVNGFDVTTPDDRTVVGRRRRTGTGNDELLVCPILPGTQARASMETVITVTVKSRALGVQRSEASIDTRVSTAFPELSASTAPPPGSADCVSNGVAERRIADALDATIRADH